MARKEETIALPAPVMDGAVSVEHALQNRRSCRDFSDAAFSLTEISQLLWAAQGVNDDEGHRTAPSAGALYPLTLYLIAGDIDGLATGIYKYHPSRHEIRLLAPGDKRGQLEAATHAQEWVADAAAIIVICSVDKRTTRKYGNRGVRYVHIEVGHAAQNVLLQAVALGLGAAVVGAFDDDEAARLLDLSSGEHPLLLLPVGRT